MRIAALIMAAGKGGRAGAGRPKQYRKIAGRALLCHTLDRFCHLPEIGSVRVIINPDDEAIYNATVEGLPLPPPITGGDSRQESVRLGLEALADQPPDIVLIHDAARPFVDTATLRAVISALAEAEGGSTGV